MADQRWAPQVLSTTILILRFQIFKSFLSLILSHCCIRCLQHYLDVCGNPVSFGVKSPTDSSNIEKCIPWKWPDDRKRSSYEPLTNIWISIYAAEGLLKFVTLKGSLKGIRSLKQNLWYHAEKLILWTNLL